MRTLSASYRSGHAALLGLICLVAVALPAQAGNDFKLKPGARGKLCLGCHESFKETLARPFLHPLLKKMDCAACHDPHTCPNEGLLDFEVDRLCLGCHEDLVSPEARSVHPVSEAGLCVTCHDPHGADKKYNLKKELDSLCSDCHEERGGTAAEVRFAHKPVNDKKGCLNCHDPHQSAKNSSLLKRGVPGLCKACHKTDGAFFRKKHLGYSVADSDCISCHDAHGSNKKGLLYDGAHAPLAAKECDACHGKPSSRRASAPEVQGNDLCRRCHEEMMAETLGKNRVHWPLLDRTGCLHCHTAHASKGGGLLKAPVERVCGSCHADTVELQKLSSEDPKNDKFCAPVKKGECTVCHSPHGSDRLMFFRERTSASNCAASVTTGRLIRPIRSVRRSWTTETRTSRWNASAVTEGVEPRTTPS